MNEEELDRTLAEMRSEEPAPNLELGAYRASIVHAMVHAAKAPLRESSVPIPIGSPAPARRPWRALLLVAALVAVGIVAAGSYRRREVSTPEAVLLAGDVVLMRGGSFSPLGKLPTTVGPGDQVGTMAEGRAAVRLRGHAIATLAPLSQMVVTPDGCEVRAGSVAFEAAKRPPGQPFVVHAGEIDVIVRGTTFRVSLDAGAKVRVEVTEGVVSVVPKEGEPSMLRAGESWPVAVPLPAKGASQPDTTPSSAPAGAEPSRGVPSAPGPATLGSARRAPNAVVGAVEPAPVSDLAEQNRLLLQAAAARKRGDVEEEQRTLDRYLTRFPDGQGAHDALVGRMRAAVAGGDARAARASAASYLQRYPEGPLRDEARATLSRRP